MLAVVLNKETIVKTVLSKDGTKIAYDKYGTGPALILVLGALNKRGSGKKLAQLLENKFTVVAYDRRGRGDSTDVQPYSVEKEVEDIKALIDELGGSAYLYGHSSGAVLALLAADKLGKDVKRLALYEVPYSDDPGAKKSAEAYRKNLREVLKEGRAGDAVTLFVRSVGVTDKQIEAMRRLPLWKSLTAMAPTLAYDTIAIMERYPKISPKVINVQSLVMHGAASPVFMADTAQKLAHAMPHAKLEALEDQSHDVKAAVLAPHLIKFFE